VPFAKKLEMFSDDPDVNSVLVSRCCRNDRVSRLQMATSYPWLASMSAATEKDDLVLKDNLGPTPEAGYFVFLRAVCRRGQLSHFREACGVR
jgi:hypothetical protein